MTAEEFAAQVEVLIADSREDGLSDAAMIAGLDEAVRALRERLS